jgi:hypothetical protein
MMCMFTQFNSSYAIRNLFEHLITQDCMIYHVEVFENRIGDVIARMLDLSVINSEFRVPVR